MVVEIERMVADRASDRILYKDLDRLVATYHLRTSLAVSLFEL
jgi:hypothetical protein